MRSIIAALLYVVAMPEVVRGTLRGPIRDQSERSSLSYHRQNLGDKIEVKRCVSNRDCAEDTYCAAGQCLQMGSCETEWDCRNPNNIYPVVECTGPLVCNKEIKQCGRECGPTCSNGSFEEKCLVDPCASTAGVCNMKNFTSCSNDYCGGCNALLFNEVGTHELCAIPKLENVDQARTCTSSVDCGESEYCSEGTCKDFGQCSSDADCFNPDNVYGGMKCVGPISCDMKQKRCSRTCDATNCPADKPPVECLKSICEDIEDSCESEVANCVDYSCGDCGAFAFDAAGYQVCKEVGPKNNPTSPSDVGHGDVTCTSAKDCAEDEYCAAGECLPDGQCNTDLDCMNPTNSYPVVLCVGVLGCYGDGICGIKCGAASCPAGATPAKCLTAPCDSPPSCEETWEYCINDYCNGECGVILLDAAGNEVTCTPTERQT